MKLSERSLSEVADQLEGELNTLAHVVRSVHPEVLTAVDVLSIRRCLLNMIGVSQTLLVAIRSMKQAEKGDGTDG